MLVEVVGEALETARQGGGPCLIEALTYRLSDHTTADDASRYRSAQEVKEAWAVEPLIRIREFLRRAGAWSESGEQALLEESARDIDAAVSAYLHTPKQSADAMFDYLFAELPQHLREQRATARRYGASSSDH